MGFSRKPGRSIILEMGALFKILSCSLLRLVVVCAAMAAVFHAEVVAQKSQCINLEEISQKKVKKYILRKNIDKMQDFSSIHPSFTKDEKETGLKVNEKIFYLRSRLASVWNGYREANPAEAFNSRSFRLEMMIMKKSNDVYYKNAMSLPVIDTGQLYFFDIRLMKGLVNVPMAFEVINIDDAKKVLEVSYIEGNKAQGKQQVQFFDNGDGRTMVVHKSFFKSHSWLRDTFLYPYFHRRLVRDYHRTMEKLVQEKSSSLISLAE